MLKLKSTLKLCPSVRVTILLLTVALVILIFEVSTDLTVYVEFPNVIVSPATVSATAVVKVIVLSTMTTERINARHFRSASYFLCNNSPI